MQRTDGLVRSHTSQAHFEARAASFAVWQIDKNRASRLAALSGEKPHASR